MHAPGISGTGTMKVSDCGFLDLSSIPFFTVFWYRFYHTRKGAHQVSCLSRYYGGLGRGGRSVKLLTVGLTVVSSMSSLRAQELVLFKGKSRPFHSFPGRDYSLGIATGYWLDGPGIESLWERDFPDPSTPALGSTQPPIQRVPGLSRG
jgi:hypothetical protein